MLTVRPATPEDSTDVLLWRNDPVTVGMSLGKTEISPEQHADWFPRTLSSNEHVHVIGEFVEGDQTIEKIGVCRFDRKDACRWLVSVNLNPIHRGKSLSAEFLDQAIQFLFSCFPSGKATLLAEIREQNIPSQRIFEKNGFRTVRKLKGVVHMERELG